MPADSKTARILMINTESGWRGGENQVALLVNGLHDFETITACQPDSPLAKRLAESGKRTEQIPMRGGFDFGAARALRRIIRSESIALVHAHTSHAHALGLLACWRTGVPLLVTRRVAFPVRGLFSGWKYGKRVRRFVAISDEIAKLLAQARVQPQRISVIRSGIDFRRFDGAQASTARREFGLGDAVVIGIVAQLTGEKDHTTLLRAFAQVARAEPKARLVIVGSGACEADLKRQAQALGLDGVIFTGHRDDIANLLGAFDVFVLSSKHEGLGTSIMDAMYVGLPVVATRTGGIPELITPEHDGLLEPVGDAGALAKALTRLCRDESLRKRLGRKAGETARLRFSHDVMVDGYRKLYRDVLAQRP
jgi:glycosyltransferase involved in cell wall biosynthesis